MYTKWLEAVDVQAAKELFYREDFPTIKVGKNFKVMKSTFIDLCSVESLKEKVEMLNAIC